MTSQPRSESISQFKLQADKLVESEIAEKYKSAPTHINLGRKNWPDVWKRLKSLSSRVQIYDHPMKYQPILDHLWQTYADLQDQTNTILKAYGEKGKEIIHSDKDSEESEEDESSEEEESSDEDNRNGKSLNFHLNKSQKNTIGGWSKNNLSLKNNIPDNNNKSSYTLINPNFVQQPSVNQSNPMGFQNSNVVLPPNFALPGFPLGQPVNINNNITFHNPNFINNINQNSESTKQKTTLKLKGKLVDISSSSESEEDEEPVKRSGSKPVLLSSVTSGKLQKYIKDPLFQKEFTTIEVETAELTPFILAAKKYYEKENDEDFLDQLLEIIDQNAATNNRISLKGWMADLFKDYKRNLDRSGGRYNELSKKQFEKLKRVREIQKIKEELSGVDVKGLKSAVIGDEIDFEAVKKLMKQGVMNHGNNNPKEENNEDPEFELGSESDQSSNESLNENDLPTKKSLSKNKRSQVLSGDENNDEKIDYGKRIHNHHSESDSDSDDDGALFLNAEEMLKATQSKLKKERKKSLKLKNQKIVDSRKQAGLQAVATTEKTKKASTALGNLSNLFENSENLYKNQDDEKSKIENKLESIGDLFKNNNILDLENSDENKENSTPASPTTTKRIKSSSGLKITINKQSEDHETTLSNGIRSVGFTSKKRAATTGIEIEEEMELELFGKRRKEAEREKELEKEKRKSNKRKVPERAVYRPRRAIENEEKLVQIAAKTLKKVKSRKLRGDLNLPEEYDQLSPKDQKKLRKELRKRQKKLKKGHKNMKISNADMLDAVKNKNIKKRMVNEWLSNAHNSAKTNQEDREEREKAKVNSEISKYHKQFLSDSATLAEFRRESMKNVSLRGGELYKELEWDRSNDESYSVPGEAFIGELNTRQKDQRKNYLIAQMDKISRGREVTSYEDVHFG